MLVIFLCDWQCKSDTTCISNHMFYVVLFQSCAFFQLTNEILLTFERKWSQFYNEREFGKETCFWKKENILNHPFFIFWFQKAFQKGWCGRTKVFRKSCTFGWKKPFALVNCV